MMSSFQHRYDDKDGTFYRSLAPDALKWLLIGKVKLRQYVTTSKGGDAWSRMTSAMHSIASDMCFYQLACVIASNSDAPTTVHYFNIARAVETLLASLAQPVREPS